jgi:hypothetical protein
MCSCSLLNLDLFSFWFFVPQSSWRHYLISDWTSVRMLCFFLSIQRACEDTPATPKPDRRSRHVPVQTCFWHQSCSARPFLQRRSTTLRFGIFILTASHNPLGPIANTCLPGFRSTSVKLFTYSSVKLMPSSI